MIKRYSALEYAVLSLLHEAPQSGYDLRRVFTATPFDHFTDSPGAIYPALRRLAARGWVRPDTPSGGRKRRAFRPTPEGRRAWLRWLAQVPTRDEVLWDDDQLMLRFAFLGAALPAPAAVRFLDAFLAECAAHLGELRRFYRAHSAGMSATGQLAFQAGVGVCDTRARWARRARRALVRKGDVPRKGVVR